MKLVFRENIDILKWDALVSEKNTNSVFSLSSYLDSVAENWCVLVSDDYSSGLAIPFTIRLGVKSCYTPIFVRYLEFFGEIQMPVEKWLEIIKSEFKLGQLNIKDTLSSKGSEKNKYQTISFDQDAELNSQAKRMLSKFDKSGITLNLALETESILERIEEELPKKVAALNDRSLRSLEKLVDAMRKANLISTILAKKGDEKVGGILLIEFNQTILYLKGAFTPEAKKEGAMYATMKMAIDHAKQKNMNFDFGGSKVEGVRRFNVNLGGKDQHYSSIEWDNAPGWYKLVKKINQAWKRK